MPGIYISDKAEIIAHEGKKGIRVTRAYLKANDSSPIVVPICCEALNVGDYIGPGWMEGFVVKTTEDGEPYIRFTKEDVEKAALIMTPTAKCPDCSDTIGRIHKLYNRQHGVGLFNGYNFKNRIKRCTESAIVCFSRPGEVIRILGRTGADEEDRFFVFLENHVIAEAVGVINVQKLYRDNLLSVPFKIIHDKTESKTSGRHGSHKWEDAHIDEVYRVNEGEWNPI